jgi:hypothetical protein
MACPLASSSNLRQKKGTMKETNLVPGAHARLIATAQLELTQSNPGPKIKVKVILPHNRLRTHASLRI